MFTDLSLIQLRPRDILDILLVTFLLYQLYRLISRSRALPVVWGLLIILMLIPVASILHLETLKWIFDLIADFIIIAVIVSLQPELRRLFYRIGQARWYRSLVPIQQVPVEEISQAVQQLAEEKTGALIVIVNRIGLRQLMEAGIMLRANISRELLLSIFYGENPLHDGAVLIEGNSILSAASYLPMSSSTQLKRTHGARHRAGLGISEESDALVIVVSEEKGYITLAHQGELVEKADISDVKSVLMAFNSSRVEEEWERLFKEFSKIRKKR